nr:recombinase family protein [uncultured Acetatifactor sp.]
MARKSRKDLQTQNKCPQPEILYDTAIYARLSIEDNGIEGDSIENQIEMIENYIRGHQELRVVHTFVDNGETGTNFERPGFSEMMEAVKKGEINCIVVKDLSRFGRNYLETGNYLEKIFPYLGIRFISVSDHYDSLHSGNSDTLLVPLKSILHDTYAKDVSRKVSSAIDIKKKSGKFMGKIPPYGYVRDEQNRYKLCVHTERAEIIRTIFKWSMEGAGPVSIAHRLNDMGIPTQFQIRYREGHHDGKENALWRGSVVTDILKNPCYIGCIVERKGSNLLCRGREDKVIPESEWNLIENAHEPIIDKETFEKVQRLISESKRKREQQVAGKSYRQRTENLLSGMVQCGICGSGVHRDGGYFRKDGSLVHYSFYCSNKYIKTGGCSSRAVDEMELYNYVYQACRKQLELLADMKELMDSMIESAQNSPYISSLKEEIRILEDKQQKLRRKRNDFYADFKDGILTEKEYAFTRDKYMTDSEQLMRQLQLANAKLQENSQVPTVTTKWIGEFIRFKDTMTLTKEMCSVMVKKVVLNENSISVHFAFADEYEKALKFLKGYAKENGDAI